MVLFESKIFMSSRLLHEEVIEMNDSDVVYRLEGIYEKLDSIANSLNDIKTILAIKYGIDKKELEEEKLLRM